MRLIGIVVALAAVVLVPAASAKEITKATACGTDGCATTRDPAVLRGLMNGGPPTVPPKMDGGVIRVRATITAEPPTSTRSIRFSLPKTRAYSFDGRPILVALAARVGSARLIDNVVIEPRES